MKLEEKNKHPRDEKVTFEEETHTYFVDETPLELSVTSFVKKFFSEFDPNSIIKKYYDFWQTNENSKYFGMTPEEIKEEWKLNGEKASKLGTKLHQDIERFYNEGEIVNDSTEFKYFKEFYQEFKYLTPYRTEWIIYEKDLGIGGSVDICFEHNGKFILMDWKRSKEIKEQAPDEGKYPLSHLPNANYWHYSLQLNVYKAILQKHYEIKIDEMKLVVFHPNNKTYQLIKVQDLQKEVEMMFEERARELKRN